MSEFGISFDYKAQNRRATIYLILPTLIVLALTIIEPAVNPLTWKSEFLILLRRFTPGLIWSFAWIAVTMSYAVFIRSLYIRFAALNTLLRSHPHYNVQGSECAKIYILVAFHRVHNVLINV